MIVDFAHMNAPTFADALRVVRGPIIVSHGNAAACCPNPRNYSDEQLRSIAERGGVVGVFFAKTFVTGAQPAVIADVVRHIDHLRKVMGEDHIALGTDFGGIITGTVAGLDAVACLPALWDALAAHGYTDAQLEKIAYRNAARVLREILPDV
jgi:membrane dipeptidase